MTGPGLHVEEHRGDVVTTGSDVPVIVLVHGVFDSCESFEPVIEHLLPEYTVLTYDRRGWGRSVDAQPAASLYDHAQDLLDVIGDRTATVVGHSYGGTVALLATVRAPARVTALGLFEPSMQWQPWWPSMDAIAAESPYEQTHFRAGLEGKPRRTREQRDREQALLQHELQLIASAPCRLDELTVPRLVGRGTLSARWRFGATDHLADELGCELVEIEGAGHTAHRMQPKGFADFARRTHALGPGLRAPDRRAPA
jgi:pimeloyl-ACP methyl ester carboxylesterase